jgi:manganese transport protein
MSKNQAKWAKLTLLGPAFVAAIAYIDPGNVATNFSAGAQYGYLLVWVVILANAMAGLVQYLSAKVGLVTGLSLPEVVRAHLPRTARLAYWAQAETIAIATDLAEVLGGAIALQLLFRLPLVWGGLITGLVSMILLQVQDKRGQRPFEYIIASLSIIIAAGFVAGLFLSPPNIAGAASGLVPHFSGINSLLLATGIFGATIMPHVVYLHSALSRDRHGKPKDQTALKSLLQATRLDVGLAMLLAGGINVAMLLLAASALHGLDINTLSDAYEAIKNNLGNNMATIIAISLLVSGLASSSVGCYAGAVVMEGLLNWRIPLLLRRVITIIPALLLLGFGAEPTSVLVLSQVVLSFGIPFAVIPLVLITSSRKIMGENVNAKLITYLAASIAGLVIALNVLLIWFTFVHKN